MIRLESERRGDYQRDTAMDHGQLSKFLEALDVYQPTVRNPMTRLETSTCRRGGTESCSANDMFIIQPRV